MKEYNPGINTKIRCAGKTAVLTACSMALMVSLSACNASENQAESTGSSTTAEITTTPSTTVDTTGRVTIESDASVMDSYDWSFSDRDLDPSYDAASATTITLSDSGTAIEGAGATTEGSSVLISEEGVYVVSGTLTDGSITVDLADETAKAQIVLAGVDITCSNGAAILVENADKVFITLAESTQNTLADGSTHEVAADENDHDGVIFAHDDLTLNGSGSLVVTGNYDNGIVGKNDVRITGGSYTIDTPGHGIQGKDCIKILDGTFTITTEADGLHASNDEDTMLGYLGVGGGTFSIAAGDDAFHAEAALLIASGTIDVSQSYEGYEGRTVSITGGVSTLVSSDDGINAASGDNLADDQGFMGPGTGGDMGGGMGPGAGGDMGGGTPPGGTAPTAQVADTTADENVAATTSTADVAASGATTSQTALTSSDCFFEMTGGSLYVKAGGDCLDSNGQLTISGGQIIAECVAAGGNGTIDCDIGATITGGTLMSVGPSDMAQGFGSGSTQVSIFLNTQTANAADKTLSLVDSSGQEICSFTPSSSNRSFVISSPDLIEGESYSIVSDGSNLGSATASLETQGMGMGGMPGGGMGGGMGGR